MATFIEIQTDAFAQNMEIAKTLVSYEGVRRPLRGIEIKEDTYSVIKVLKANGDAIPLTDSGGMRSPQSGTETSAGGKTKPKSAKSAGATTYNYSNYIIQRIDENRQEKSQILETFGEAYIFFFGERPRLLNVSGLLMNTVDFNWRTEFWYNYENVLRGTKLVEQNARIYLFYDDIVIEGYMLGASARDDADMPYHIPFNFSLFVTNHMYLSTVGDDNYPITHAVNLQPLLQDQDVQKALNELKADQRAAQKYVSTTEEVRLAAEQAQLERIDDSNILGVSPETYAKVGKVKNILLNALALGINAQNMTFLSIVNHFFKNRKMRFPKGLAGAEAMVGPPSYANDPGVWEANPQRTMPLRSKIRDNVDEYVEGAVQPANLDEDAINQALLDSQSSNPYQLELRCLEDLAELGLDPVQHPGGSPLKYASGLITIPTEIPDVLIRGFGGG